MGKWGWFPRCWSGIIEVYQGCTQWSLVELLTRGSGWKRQKKWLQLLNGCKSWLIESWASSPHFSSLSDAGPLKPYIVQLQHHRRTPILLSHHITTNQLIKTTWSLLHSRMVPKESSQCGLQPTKTTYLLCYNLLSALLWLCIFLSVMLQLDVFFLSEDRHRSSRRTQTYAYLEAWTRWTPNARFGGDYARCCWWGLQ